MTQIVNKEKIGIIPAFSIVVFREVFYETLAFRSLMNNSVFKSNGTKPVVFVYDNTDLPNWMVSADQIKEAEVHYFHNSANPGISVAYNFLASQARGSHEWMVFLDQDTTLPEDAVAGYSLAIKQNPDLLLKVPVLKVQESIFSPSATFLRKSVILKQITTGETSLQNRTVVNSGLMVNLPLFFRAGGYDERVKLDFADFLFIDRLRKHISTFEVLPIVCQHEFSHNETDIRKALDRYKIFKSDLASCPRYSWQDTIGYFLVGASHLVKLTTKFRSLKFLKQ